MSRKKRAAKAKNSEKRHDGPAKKYDLTAKNNELFVKYYKGQNIIPESEWDAFYATLQKILPVTFRISGHRAQAEELLNTIKGKFFSSMLNVKVDDEVVPPPKNLTWYPNELAWQLDLSRKSVRSSECFSKLHEFLVAETDCGAISRQEAVSMIPPLLMDIKSHHKILDMCASPGSKTAQLIEYLHSSCAPGELPTGYVMANDTDNKRCYLMVHQVKRLQSPCCVIVNHDGRRFPKIYTNKNGKNPDYQLFDRILCDVPCSGDGTMRKNFDVWSKWHPLQGANMHGLQCKILQRGCQLLEVGGRIVYSTCSMNPAEDEAVIADLLRSSNGAMELVEVADSLPGLKFTRGLSHWRVMTKVGEWLDDKDKIPANLKTQYKETIYPPSPEEAEKFHLERCMRILPHHQDSGGFFVAVLQKKHHLPGSKEAKQEIKEASGENSKAEETPASDDGNKAEVNGDKVDSSNNTESADASGDRGKKRKTEDDLDEPEAKKQRMFGYKEDPFLFMQADDPIWPQLRDFFGLTQDFNVNQLMCRSAQGKRTIYFVSDAVRNITECNEGRIKFINMGVKCFSRSPSPMVPDCDFRMATECLNTLVSTVTKRKVSMSWQDAITIMSEENPFIQKLSEGLQSQLHAMPPGSTLFTFTPSEKEPVPKCEVSFCGWRGKNSVRCFGSRPERAHGLMLFGEDLGEINRRVEERKKAKKLAQEEGQNQDNSSAVSTVTAAAGVDGNDEDKPPPCEDDEEGKQEDEGIMKEAQTEETDEPLNKID
ncbi:tRNA (cytosine(34)-c(5))-methyltransferase [Plakobranchus ocellatus]|uniref:tRNA (cytosine(34)-C(5))-methyltransferase n=1 Tax=Plakobranchus ocellatus TaxID=259542 RepID=A0AAV3ZN90_9GAST|nr:tRNA (cytosine(34)-c(5))-methyltransferase [Plakobranchus ocellatus]